jgi:hypothetical protein
MIQRSLNKKRQKGTLAVPKEMEFLVKYLMENVAVVYVLDVEGKLNALEEMKKVIESTLCQHLTASKK